MTVDLFANVAATTLGTGAGTTFGAAGASPGASETWTLASTAAPLPQIGLGQQARFTVGAASDTSPEICWGVATLSGTTMTVLRGMEGSTIKAHAVGDAFTATVTAGVFTGLAALTQAGQEQLTSQNALALSTLRAALTNAGTTACNIWWFGASLMEGMGAPLVQQRWVNQVIQHLKAKFQPFGVPGGLGFIPCYYTSSTLPAPATAVGSPGTASFAGLGGRAASLTTSQSLTWPVFGTSVDVCFINSSLSNNILCSVDGAGATTITNPGAGSGSNVDMWTSRVTFGARGAHTVNLTAAAGTTYVDGLIAYDGDETVGVRTYDGSHFGWASTDFYSNLGNGGIANYAAAPLQQHAAKIQPNAVFIEIGGNDFLHNTAGSGTTTGATTMLSNLQSFITNIRAGCTVPPVIIIVPDYQVQWTVAGNTGTAPEPWADFLQELYALVLSDSKLALLDLGLRFPQQVNDTQSLYYTDNLHPSAKGNLYISEFVTDWIGGAALPSPDTGVGTPNTSAQSLSASTRTVITGSSYQLPTLSGLQVGSRFRWILGLTKTTAGTAAFTVILAFGTAGTSSDGAIATWTSPANTGIEDRAMFIIDGTVTALGSGTTATMACIGTWVNQATDATGMGFLPPAPGSTAGFNSTATAPFLHVDVTPGTSAVMTGWATAEQLK